MVQERAAHTLKDTTITLQVSDGTKMNAYVASPNESGSHPGLLVFQEAFGINEHIRGGTRRFAGQGFVAIAPELFHRTAQPGFEGSYSNFAGVIPHMKAMTTEGAIADSHAAFEWLTMLRDVSQDDIFVRRLLYGRANFVPGEFSITAAKGDLVLRREYRSGGTGTHCIAARPDAVFLGRLGQTHPSGTARTGDRRS